MRRLALGLLCLALAAPAGAQSKPKKVTLKSKSIKKLRLGWDVEGEIPKSGSYAKLGQRTYLFVDLDGNGRLTTDGKDGLAIAGLPFVVPLPSTLLTELGQFDIAFEGGKLTLRKQKLAIPAALVKDAGDLTVMRVMAGLHPVVLDETASQHCVLHCDYLFKNNQHGGAGGVSAHKQTPGKPGYTTEGARAGRLSDLYFSVTRYADALWGWYRTAWHGIPIVRPGLRKVGVGLKHGVAMLYFYGSGPAKDPRLITPQTKIRPFAHPAPGATNIPTAFDWETPNPVPGTVYGRGSGFPLTIQLAGSLWGKCLVKATLTTARGARVAGTFSCPRKPANRSWPGNSGAAVFIPKAPLAPRTEYKATFVFEGVAKPVVWTFRTGTKAKGR